LAFLGLLWMLEGIFCLFSQFPCDFFAAFHVGSIRNIEKRSCFSKRSCMSVMCTYRISAMFAANMN